MSFEVSEPGTFTRVEALPEGWCAISRNASAVFHAEDLALVGIENRAVILVDVSTLRIALRSVRDGEDRQAVAVGVVRRKGRDTTRRRVGLALPIKRLALEAEAVRGRYELTTKKGSAGAELIIIHLAAEKLGKGRQ